MRTPSRTDAGKIDEASSRAPGEPGASHLRLLLAGDLESPQQVLAATNLSSDQKRDIFTVWLRDLEAAPADERVPRLVAEIRAAIATLGKSEKPAR